MHYLFHLRTAKHWTPAQRREYFGYWTADRSRYAHEGDVVKWFELAGRPYGDGASFNNFLKNFLTDAVAHLSESEKAEFGSMVGAVATSAPAKKAVAADPFPAPRPRGFVKSWTMADLATDMARASAGRDFRRGRQAFVDAQCLACHRFGNEGGGVGPDLTAVNARFKAVDILESILDPSKVVSEQFQNTMVTLKNGDDQVGRLVDETADTLVLVPNPLAPDERVVVKKADVASRSFSKVSPMPSALVDGLSKEDLLDLVAFLEAGGRADHAVFRK